MARGDFGKAFSQHRKDGGVLTRKEFAEQYKAQKKIPEQVDSSEEVRVDGEA